MTTRPLPHPDAFEVINVGLEIFATELTAQGVTVVHVEWQPPLGGVESARSLLRLLDETAAER